MNRRGLSLFEVATVMSLIGVLMALSLPMMSRANAEARSIVCRENLADMGGAITGYIVDHKKLPILTPLPPHHEGTSLPELIKPRLRTPNVVFCPSDETEKSQTLGTSYRWSVAYNGLPMDRLEQAVDKPILTDRDAFHAGAQMAVNELILQRNDQGSYNFSVVGTTEGDAGKGSRNNKPKNNKDKDKPGERKGHNKNSGPDNNQTVLPREKSKRFGRWRD